jgi:hypothetical protein
VRGLEIVPRIWLFLGSAFLRFSWGTTKHHGDASAEMI